MIDNLVLYQTETESEYFETCVWRETTYLKITQQTETINQERMSSVSTTNTPMGTVDESGRAPAFKYWIFLRYQRTDRAVNKQ